MKTRLTIFLSDGSNRSGDYTPFEMQGHLKYLWTHGGYESFILTREPKEGS